MLERQRAAFLREGPPSLAARRRDLMRLKDAVLARQEEFVTALNADFGHRARQESLLLDLGSMVGTIKYLHRNLPTLDAARVARASPWCSFRARTASSISRSA